MLISVIVPVYNCESTILNCLESISKQKYKELEIIIVNDGSKDSTLKIVEDYSLQDRRIKIITQNNGGPGNARNTGLKVLSGDYFAFVDADDTVEPNYIESMYEMAVTKKLDLVMCKPKKSGKKYKIEMLEDSMVFNGKSQIMVNIIPLIQKGLLNSPCCKLYSSRLQKKYDIMMPVNIDIGEDLQFNLSYIQYIHTLGILNKYLYNYHTENSFLTKKHRTYEYDSRVTNIRNLEIFLNSNKVRGEQFISYLYLKLMYAESMNMYDFLDKNRRLDRIDSLLKKKEIQRSITLFRPIGLLEQVMHWGCKTYDAKRINNVARLLRLGKKMNLNVKRASV